MIFGNIFFFILSVTALPLQRRDVPTTDRILAYLESASVEEQQHFFESSGPEVRSRLPDVLKLSLFEGKPRAFGAFLRYPTLVDWRSPDLAVHISNTIVSPAKLISILDVSASSLSTMAPQSLQFALFLVANQDTLANVADRSMAQLLIWRGLNWGSIARSSSAVQTLIGVPTIASAIPTIAYQEALWRSVETDNVPLFKLLVETPSSWGRYAADPSVWNQLFKKSIGYDFNMRSSHHQRAKIMKYFLESDRIMRALSSKTVNKIFDAAFANADYTLMSSFMNNRVAMTRINAQDFNAFVQKTIKNPKNPGGQEMAHLIMSKEESLSRISDDLLGDLFVISAKSGWTAAFDYVLSRPDLLNRISSKKFNLGLMIRMEDRTDLVAARLMLDSETFLAKMDRRSIGQVFISLVTVQDMPFITSVLANANIMGRIESGDLYRALKGLLIKNVQPGNTDNVVRMFMGNAFIARLRDEDLRSLVKDAIKYNRLESLMAILEQSNVVARLSTSFLREVEKNVINNEAKAMISAEIQHRPRPSFADGVRGIIERIGSHDMRPIVERVPPAFPRIRAP